MLKLADNLDLPLEFVTERIAFLARTGAGKSGGMRVLFEQMFDAGLFCVFIDPKGDAWGIRAAGEQAGKPVLIIGGDHADIPLAPDAGKYIAEFLVSERVSTVLDLTDLSTQQMWTFIADLGERMYKLNRDICHVFIDEADMIAGQQFFDPHCLHAIQLIQNKGRHRGFGMTIATQRPQILNKTVLNASGTLIAMQTIGDDALKVVKSWLGQTGSKETIQAILGELPRMQNREAFVYSPQTLGTDPVRIRFASFQTYDSMRTPRPGESRQQPKSVADIDLSKIRDEMAATIEESQANDPKRLKLRISALEKEVTQLRVQGEPKLEKVEVIKEVPVPVPEWPKEVSAEIVRACETIKDLLVSGEMDYAKRGEAFDRFKNSEPSGFHHFKYEPLSASNEIEDQAPRVTDRPKRTPNVTDPSKGRSNVKTGAISSERLPEGEYKILTVIIQYSELGGADREQIGILSGYKRSSRDTYISRLSQKGFIALGPKITATAEGRAVLGDAVPALPTGIELQDYWLVRLPEGEAKILKVLLGHPWGPIDRETIGRESGYKRSSRDTYISRLRTRRLVELTATGVRASDLLFD